MKNKPMKLSTLLLVYAFDMLLRRINRNQKISFPEKIGSYMFDEEFKIRGKPQQFHFAIYKTKDGKKALAKFWTGKVKDFSYFTLKNESIIYSMLNSVQARTKGKIPLHLKNVFLPKLEGVRQTHNSLLLLVEYVEGRTADNLSKSRAFEAYLKTSELLKYLGENLEEKEKEQIAYRSPWQMIAIYPLLLLKAISTHPRTAVHLIRGVPLFIEAIPLFLNKNQNVLGHRDLHLGNILVHGKNTYLIDLQFCLISDRLYDMLSTLRIHWKDVWFSNKLLSEIKNISGRDINSQHLVRGLMVKSATQGLSSNIFPKKTIDQFINFLQFSINSQSVFSVRK